MNGTRIARGIFGRSRGRSIATGVAVFGLFGAVPAVSQAVTAVQPAGIAGAGTVSGTWTSGQWAGQTQVVQVASNINCVSRNPPLSFDASWTDPAGASHLFKLDSPTASDSCSFPNGFTNPPQFARMQGFGSTSGLAGASADDSSMAETLTGPKWSPPNTMQFDLTTREGIIDVPAQFPGRIQAYNLTPSAA